jgi:PTH1 family peptidyl-tRNA hydrolase
VGLFSGRRSGDTPPEWIVLGLGNPGDRYANTRHNVGDDAVRLVGQRVSTSFKAGKNDAFVAETRILDQRCVLAIPITFMNESGRAAASLIKRFGLTDPSKLIVVHDELDLEPGDTRLKMGGGLAGHNGLRSIAQHLGTNDFLRVRIGVGRPPSADRGADWVLSKVPQRSRPELDIGIVRAADAVELVVSDGVDSAMQSVNRR